MSKPEFKQYDDVFFNGVRAKIVGVNPISKTFNVRSANSLAQGIEAKDLFATYEEWQAAHSDDPLVKPVDLLAWHKPPVAPRPTPKLTTTPQPKTVQGDQFIAPMSKIEAQSLVNQIRSGFTSIADKLHQLKERDGWKALGYTSWRSCVTAEFELSQTRVYQLLSFAEVQQNISTIVEKLPEPLNEAQARELAKVPAEQQAVILEKAIETSPKGKPSAAHIKRTIETETIKTETKVDVIDPETGEILNRDTTAAPPTDKLAVHYSSESSERYTPIDFMERVREVIGDIDLDPASNEMANRVVCAARYFDFAANGLTQSWTAHSLFHNPPYGDEIDAFIRKAIEEYEGGSFEKGILLVPARTDTVWFQLLRKYPRCFITGRLKFWNDLDPSLKSGAPFPSAAIYLGKELAVFGDVFSRIGDVYQLWSPE